MKTQPNNISFDELSYVLISIGCERREGKGSHYIFFIPGTNLRQTVPKRKPVKAIYIKRTFDVFGLEEKLNEEN